MESGIRSSIIGHSLPGRQLDQKETKVKGEEEGAGSLVALVPACPRARVPRAFQTPGLTGPGGQALGKDQHWSRACEKAEVLS